MNECMPIFTNSAGTIMEKYIEDKILLTIGDYGACGVAKNYAQDDNHLAGKTLLLMKRIRIIKLFQKDIETNKGFFMIP